MCTTTTTTTTTITQRWPTEPKHTVGPLTLPPHVDTCTIHHMCPQCQARSRCTLECDITHSWRRASFRLLVVSSSWGQKQVKHVEENKNLKATKMNMNDHHQKLEVGTAQDAYCILPTADVSCNLGQKRNSSSWYMLRCQCKLTTHLTFKEIIEI